MAAEIISSGVVSSGGSIYGKDVEIYGTASDIVFQNCSDTLVMNDGKAIDTTLESYTQMTVQSGGMASNTRINSCTMIVSAGGTANTVTGIGMYSCDLVVHGIATDISGRCRLKVMDGGQTTNAELTDIAYVSNGGTAINTTMNLAGNLYVYAGGVVSSSTLLASAYCTVFGKADDTCLKDDKTSMFVEDGGNASITHISAGKVFVSKGGGITETHISGGAMDVSNGGTATDTTMTGGALTVAGIATSNTVTNATISVEAPGIATSNTVTGGTFTIAGVATSNSVTDGATSVETTGTATSNTVTGGTFIVAGKATSNTVTDGTTSVEATGTATSNTVTGGSFSIAGTATSTTMTGGTMSVEATGTATSNTVINGSFTVAGTATGTTLFSGGIITVESGGVANITTVTNGTMAVFGAATSTTLSSGGIMIIESGATATTIHAHSGAIVNLLASSVSKVNLSGGIVMVSSGGQLTGTIARNGEINVLNSGKIVGNRASSAGVINIKRGGIASGCTVASSGHINVAGGSAFHTEVGSGGLLVIEAFPSLEPRIGEKPSLIQAGSASNTKVAFGGLVSVGSGGMAFNTYLASSGGTGELNPGRLDMPEPGGKTDPAQMTGRAAMVITSSGLAKGVTASSGGILIVEGKGTLVSASLSSGAVATVMANGIASGISVYKGASATIRGSASLLTVSSGGLATLDSGASIQGAHVGSDGLLRVSAGAKVSELAVTYGKITGRFANLSSQAITMSSGILDFDISALGTDDVCVDKLNYGIGGTYFCTLTVSGSQEDGTYKLAGDAAGFSLSIDVLNKAGTTLGTLEVGRTVNLEGTDYTLNLGEDEVLSVTVGAAVPTPAYIARGDRDGNGVSDVMFVWEANNCAHGYWMNGTNDWWSANAPGVSPDWDNLGSYDMSGDGKADAVMFGNVIVNDARGAYIGYYQDGNDMDGWVTIGFLDNAENIAWQNKVGNLTGTRSVITSVDGFAHSHEINSIVWYAPELYALGVWTDGTTDWVSLSASFGGDAWTLVGCGDFDGDGRDSVLMTYNGGQLFYAVGIDGAAAALGSANWSGWEVRAIGDFAGDGKDDLVLFHKETGSMVMCADGSVDSYTSIGQLDPNDWFIAGCGDYNGDQKDDLLVRQYSTGMLGYYSEGNQANWNVMGYGVGMEWTVIA